MFSIYPVTHIFSPMKNRPPVKFYDPLWPTSQNVDSCYRATRSSISSFIRRLRNGSFMTFLRSTGTQTKSRQEFLFACLGFCFLRPAGLQQQPREGVWVRKPCWQAGGGAEAQQMKSRPSISCCWFPLYLVLPRREGERRRRRRCCLGVCFCFFFPALLWALQ